jgi:ATP-dependent helicase HrpA
VRDIETQLGRLMPKDFILATPWERLQRFPVYLRAAGARLDKLRADPARDRRAAAELAPLETQWLREDARQRKAGGVDPRLEQFRWLLEELRVQLFAQELRTPVPVSAKRLAKLWQTLGR